VSYEEFIRTLSARIESWQREKQRRLQRIEELKKARGEGVQEIKCKHCDAVIRLHYPPKGTEGLFIQANRIVGRSIIPPNPDEPTRVATVCPNGHMPVYTFDWKDYRYK
jgi:hypothetical protein